VAYDPRVKRRRIVALVLILLAFAVFVVVTRGPEPVRPVPSGTIAFAVLGDAPYYAWEELQYRRVRQELDANELAFVIHVGDIFWRPCTDAHYREVLGWFNALRHPVIYTPGDNETYDCWEDASGGFAPQDRFAAIRRIFFADPTHSLGRTALPLASQGGEFVENVRWTHDGLVFATVDMIGSRNGLKPYPGRPKSDDDASRRRTEAAARWTTETFRVAAETQARAVVISFHATPGFDDPPYRAAFEPFLETLEAEAERFARPVLVLHGDGHKYTIDRPARAKNIERVQVPGSPRVGWVRVIVHPGATTTFTFERYAVPRWKYW
jgi:hypothetical protein